MTANQEISREAAEAQAFREQCRRQMARPISTRMKYGFCRVHRPVLDTPATRIFPSTQAYREWCAENLPAYLGYHPLTAKNGREAVEVCRQEHPDFILMDLQMPEMDGIEATINIRALEKSLPNHKPTFISALTANIYLADRQRCFDAGMNTYLNKPLKTSDLVSVLTQA